MKRTPIIVPGQVYLHNILNEYSVVTKATRGDIQFKGSGFGGMNEVELFLKRFSPVDPADMEADEVAMLRSHIGPNVQLSTGWVTPDDEMEQEEDE